MLIADELRDNPDRTDREIGAALGVDHKTVAIIRRELESVGEIPQQDTRTGADGKSRPARKPIRYTLVAEPFMLCPILVHASHRFQL